MSKSILIVYSCYNPSLTLIKSIESLYDIQFDTDINYKIVCIDNNSSITLIYDVIKDRFSEIEIIFANNQNYEWGAYKYAYEKYPNYDLYFCLQDTIVLTKKINLADVKDNVSYSVFHSGGFKNMGRFYSLDEVLNQRLLKNLNVNDMIERDFIMAQHNTFIVTNLSLNNLFKFFINPPLCKIDAELSERLIGIYFIKNDFIRLDLNPYVQKIIRELRSYE